MSNVKSVSSLSQTHQFKSDQYEKYYNCVTFVHSISYACKWCTKL